MTETMNLLVIELTGHIVAATAPTVPAGEPKAADLAGTDFPISAVRDEQSALPAISTLLPSELLTVKAVAFDAQVIADPQAYVVDGGRVVRLPVGSAPVAADYDLSADKILVKNGPLDATVLAILAAEGSPDQERRAQAGRFVDVAGTATATLNLSVLPDDTTAGITTGDSYDVMIAQSGQRLLWLRATA